MSELQQYAEFYFEHPQAAIYLVISESKRVYEEWLANREDDEVFQWGGSGVNPNDKMVLYEKKFSDLDEYERKMNFRFYVSMVLTELNPKTKNDTKEAIEIN